MNGTGAYGGSWARLFVVLLVIAASWATEISQAAPMQILAPHHFKHYIEAFNRHDRQLYPSWIRNSQAWQFLKKNIPLFDCPDKTLEQIYYFRWWTYRKHIEKTPAGYVITEFLPPVPWAGQYNTIDCAAGQHFYEGRWLHDPIYMQNYAAFWLKKGGQLRKYSFWIANALWNNYLVTGDARFVTHLLPQLVANYRAWEKERQGPDGLFWQIDDLDGMEMSAGGSGFRPTINSYMYGDARAIYHIAILAGRRAVAQQFRHKAIALRKLVERKLWNKNAQFFETRKRGPRGQLGGFVNVREEIGFTPWYFRLPQNNRGYSVAWSQLMNRHGFMAPFGPTTCEQRSRRFKISYQGHECQWDGPSWPFATSITLTAMANLLDESHQHVVNKSDYFKLLEIYAHSQYIKTPSGALRPWIDEDLNPFTGDWIAHRLLLQRHQAPLLRGKDYNHSTYCDLVISGLVGLRPRADNLVEVKPLVPPGRWPYFCLDHVLYHGHILAILYDKTGRHYGKGQGLNIFIDGKLIAHRATLGPLDGKMPQANTATR